MNNFTNLLPLKFIKKHLMIITVILFILPFGFISYVSVDGINKEIALSYNQNLNNSGNQNIDDLKLKRLEIYLSLLLLSFLGTSLILYLKHIQFKKEQERELYKSNKKFDAIINNIPAIFFRCKNDADWTMIYLNKQITELTGYEISDFIGNKVRSYSSIIHPEDQNYVAEKIAEEFSKNQKYSIEYRIVAADESIKWVHEQGEAVRDENGTPYEIDGFIYDFTAQKNQAQKEKDHTTRLELSEQIAEIGYWEFNPTTQEVFWSDRVYTIHGVNRDAYVPNIKTALNFYHPDDIEFVKKELKRSSLDKVPFDIRARIIRSDGQIRNIYSRGVPTFNDSKELQSIVGIFQDITDNVRQGIELNEALSFQKLIMENIPDYIFVKDSEYKIVNANTAFLSLYPEDIRSKIIGSTTLEEYSEEERNLFLQYDKIAFEKGISENEETVLFPNGENITLRTIKKRFYNSNGEPFILGICHNITAQKLFERDITNHKENLEKLVQDRTRDLQKALDDSKIAERAKSDFFANMSHELRTPLNSIIGMSQLIETTDLDDDQTEMFASIRQSGNILLKTVNDILDISKIEAKELKLEIIPFDIFDNLRGTAQSLKSIASAKNLSLTHDFDGLSQPVFGDPTRFSRITTNLIANAIRYTDEGSISMTSSFQSHPEIKNVISFTLEITDTGIGIPSSKLETIFEKFIQADSSITRRFGGTGLGLAISKDLVELMNGVISVESEVDKGSTFTITIPFKMAEAKDLIEEDDETLFIDKFDVNHQRIHVSSARFLLAEDNEMNQLFIRRLLDNLGAKHYRIVENGDLAVKEVQNNNYDIVLMDCHMPILSGYDATIKIRFLNDPFAASVPIIAMTANAMPEDKARCLQTGMNAYISKPIEIENFKEILSQWINFDVVLSEEIEDDEFINDDDFEIPPVNLDNLISNSNGDEEFVKEILVLFTKQATDQISILKTLCIDGESKEWVDVSHSLKGTAGAVGAESLRLLCATAQKIRISTVKEREALIENIEFEYQRAKDYLIKIGKLSV